jgi:hypothetical protein
MSLSRAFSGEYDRKSVRSDFNSPEMERLKCLQHEYQKALRMDARRENDFLIGIST